jgi:very-short-patch-repair endonuclease
LQILRAAVELPWDRLVGDHIARPFSSLGAEPELSCRALIPEMRRSLDWHELVWRPLALRLEAEGLRVDDVMAAQRREASPTADYTVIERAASTLLPALLEAEGARRRLRECEVALAGLSDLATRVDPLGHQEGAVGRIHAAVVARDPAAYTAALEYARHLHRLRPSMTERDARIERLAVAAPVWAERVAQRAAPHDAGTVPGDATMAWIWRQLHDSLAERDKLDAHEFQRQIDRAERRLRDVTAALIEARAWGRQLERLQSDQAMQQALVGWLDTTRRLLSTRQPERRQTLLTEGRKLMKKCADAVPVWIMPIPIVAESFDPATARFDVVIIDEASQADLNALIPLYLGSQIVIVGDNEQVTPLGVGKSQAQLETLRRTMLEGIPNAHLFDHQVSIYDVARQSFGDAVRLVEHFRCVPEIIAFSNQLSYEGAIRPLRESTSTDIKPACVPCRVHGVREGDTNQVEARRIVDTIQSMIRHPKYAGKTMGIISMVGEAQAILIQSMIHKQIPGIEIEKRRIRAGVSGEFQGDERDVIFLSMVDSPTEGGPLRTVGEGAFEQTKRRFNVAASRARDQMWVMHSFDPDLHLRAADLRLGLLRHMREPEATIKAAHQDQHNSESPFEREVIKRLSAAGYLVRPQWQVGYYRIDVVVEGGGRRLAVECDGDRYQPIEQLADDVERQSILERLGWEFVRLRGSVFFRDPDAAMRPVFDRLRERDIPAVGSREDTGRSDVSLLQELDALVPRGIEREELFRS